MSIYRIISDSEVLNDASISMRNRNIDQKFLYHGKGASLYYDFTHNDKIFSQNTENKLSNEDIFNFGLKNCFTGKFNTALISLGCGDSNIEKTIYENLDDNFVLDYFGIDFSDKMLELSRKSLEDIDRKKTFIYADFASTQFKYELERFTSEYEDRIFSFFSNTFGNINHTNIIDILYSILNKGEKIWLDVRLRKSQKALDDMKIFNIHEINNNSILEEMLNTMFGSYGIPAENGYFSKKMSKIDGINAITISFYFTFTKKTIIDLDGRITFLPNESIKCQQIYYYDSENLIDFFSEHGFKLIDKEEKNMRGQFLFKKK